MDFVHVSACFHGTARPGSTEEEEEEEGTVFDKPDNCTHAQEESYRLDVFSIRQCVCKCSLLLSPNMLFGLFCGLDASTRLLVDFSAFRF